ncbi:MAG: DUF2460 domain-containing protein [Henriciella sp.]|uniref:phage distal tail protein, Rcc01695 family n=1 Tax=Henriciella sp. TaxID=1968823 RepID=UPI003C720CF6
MSLSQFHEVLFPLALGRGASGGPGWKTEVVALASGGEVRNARWAGARRRWDVASAITSDAALAALADFYDARRGRLYGFRFRDLLDHSSAAFGNPVSASDQAIGIGDGTQTDFQLSKSYGGVRRAILKPVVGSVAVALGGTAQAAGWSVDETTGVVSFDAAPASGVAVSAGFKFDCPVRFDTDTLEISIETIGAGRAVSVPLVELV